MADSQSESDYQPRYAEDLGPLDLSAYPDAGPGDLHTQNDRLNPFQRDNIIERKGKVDVRCEHKDVVHGFHSDDVDDPYSLIVYELQFSPNGVARRIKEAHVVIKYSAMKKGDPDPVVVGMYPKGTFSVEPTTQHETKVRGGGVNLGGGVAGVEIGGDLKAEDTIERDTTDATVVRGSIDLRGRNWGDKNSVAWTLLENKATKTGVVRSMQAAVLLKRKDLEHFKATVTIDIDADILTNVGSVFKRDPKDDDVWYNPERQPPSTNRLQKYDINNLSKFPLQSVSDVTFVTVLKGAAKEA